MYNYSCVGGGIRGEAEFQLNGDDRGTIITFQDTEIITEAKAARMEAA